MVNSKSNFYSSVDLVKLINTEIFKRFYKNYQINHTIIHAYLLSLKQRKIANCIVINQSLIQNKGHAPFHYQSEKIKLSSSYTE